MRGTVAVSVLLMATLLCPIAASAEEIPPDVQARIKAYVAQQYPGNYAVQKMLVEADVQAWKELNQ